MSDLEERVRARITELREVEQAATAGPWQKGKATNTVYAFAGGIFDIAATDNLNPENATLIVVARNLLPGVLDAAEKILDLHHKMGFAVIGNEPDHDQPGFCGQCEDEYYPCPTVLAVAGMLGVTVDE